MERTTTTIVFIIIALVCAGLLIGFIGKWKGTIQQPSGLYCDPEPLCEGRTNGESFCNDDGTALISCIREECMKKVMQECTCVDGRCSP